MIRRLPVSLAQMKAESNSEKINKTTIVFFISFKKTKQNNL